jgi:tight adherence protein C
VLLAYGLMPARQATRRQIASNLARGNITNLREIALSASARDRAIEPLVGTFAAIGRRFTPAGSIASLERRHELAGRPSAWPLERLLAAKIILGLLAAVIVLVRVSAGATTRTMVVTVVLAVLLYVSPDVFITGRAKERQREILHDLPDALDQMTICMEAGLGFEAAMARTSQSNDGPLAQELVRLLQEIQVGVGRRQALTALADRNDVPDLRHFVTALQQAESYGVPISRVLNDQARDLRAKRRQRAEEMARKMPLKMLIPLILFILPPLFIVLLGPAGIAIMDAVR